MRFTVEKIRQNKLSDNSKEEKTRFELSREMIKQKFFRLLFAHFDNFFAVRQRQKKMNFEREK